jgi:DNA ligase (NAD+)
MTEADYLELCATVRRHNAAYYDDATPEISDGEYDALFRLITQTEATNPTWATDDSPTKRAGGGETPSGFKPYVHTTPMLSLENAYNESDVGGFLGRVRMGAVAGGVETVVDPKVDGVAITVRYDNGELTQGGTRGRNGEGDDVTANVRTIRGLPRKIEGAPPVLEVRGEIFMTFAGFSQANVEREAAGDEMFANPRNAAAGSLKMHDTAEVAKRPLQIVLYNVVQPRMASHTEAMQMLKGLGLPVHEWQKVCKSQSEVFDAIAELDVVRKTLAYPTDGAVVKVNNTDMRESLGATGHSPRWAFAYKFTPDRAETKLRAVTNQVGRTGAITPVGELDPVPLSGSTLSRVTLHNFVHLAAKGLHVGDTVVIEKAGEVIPAIVGVVKEKRPEGAQPILPPTECPCCTGPVSQVSKKFFCTSSDCEAQTRSRIEHFASRDGLRIEGLGESLCAQLVDAQLVHSVADLYTLKKPDLLSLPGVAEKGASNILAAIEASKKQPLQKLVYGLGITQIGVGGSKALCGAFSSLREMSEASSERLTAIRDIGPETALHVRAFFANPNFPALFAKLEAAGLNLTAPKTEDTGAKPFAGMTFVITGTFSQPRPHFATQIEALGGKCSGSVSKKTNYLLAGSEAGSKLADAQKHGIPVLSEDAFDTMRSKAVALSDAASPEMAAAPIISAPAPSPTVAPVTPAVPVAQSAAPAPQVVTEPAPPPSIPVPVTAPVATMPPPPPQAAPTPKAAVVSEQLSFF